MASEGTLNRFRVQNATVRRNEHVEGGQMNMSCLSFISDKT